MQQLLPGTAVRYVDRWEPQDNRQLFPELGDAAPFPEPDIISNLDLDRLSSIPSGSQDFVIASHVLEHVAEPLGLLADIHRALRPGGVVLILLPDRRRTFDRHRAPTPLQHLADEHAAGVTEVDDAHVEEFLRGTGEDVDAMPAEKRPLLFDLHRRRSIHVHCWSEKEWSDVIEHCIARLRQEWELVEVLNNADVADSIEFGLVLRRSIAELPSEVLLQRFQAQMVQFGPASVTELHDQSAGVAIPSEPVPAQGLSDLELQRLTMELELSRQDARNWQLLAQDRGSKLNVLVRSPLGPVLRFAWTLRRRARGG